MDRENKAYQRVQEHRRKCKKWGKEFCMECFGMGLNKFYDDYDCFFYCWQSQFFSLLCFKQRLKFEEDMKEIRKITEKRGI